MHFLCLHGIGTNSKVFETQTAAIRTELGDGHTYDFVEGTLDWPKAPELGSLFSDDDQYFAYYDPYNATSFRTAILQLEEYIKVEGPFDGVLAFSHGAALSSTLLLGQLQATSDGIDRGSTLNPFKCAIFLAAGIPWNLESLKKDELVRLDREYGSRISIPTAHVWAANDPLGPSMSAVLEDLCVPQVRHVYIHNEGHTVPGRRSPETLRNTINVIRRVLWDVTSAA
ncbi:hypothetical protein TWF481_004918 [Arthrobotrys musiformis]|uniref:Serine hydrolase domain-containing protein n=1 Tax=Arthrobotrys musiformis TaxID=47236 RepID=A0AAV9WMJ7_9PEZI